MARPRLARSAPNAIIGPSSTWVCTLAALPVAGDCTGSRLGSRAVIQSIAIAVIPPAATPYTEPIATPSPFPLEPATVPRRMPPPSGSNRRNSRLRRAAGFRWTAWMIGPPARYRVEPASIQGVAALFAAAKSECLIARFMATNAPMAPTSTSAICQPYQRSSRSCATCAGGPRATSAAYARGTRQSAAKAAQGPKIRAPIFIDTGMIPEGALRPQFVLSLGGGHRQPRLHHPHGRQGDQRLSAGELRPA